MATDPEMHPTVQQVLDSEPVPVPDIYRENRPADLGTDPVPVEQYTSRAFHDLEMEKMWSRVWQMACREEEIPNVGDHLVYEIGDTSLLIVRSAPNEFRALHNSCLHRGTSLRSQGGNTSAFKCPFHGWTWNLDGSLKEIPCRWDFPQVRDEEFGLPQAKVDTWGGFVFVNLDPQAAPLADFIGVVPDHFAPYAFEKRVQAAHVRKVIQANWKAVTGAFIESYHVRATHPQIMPYLADTNTQYDVYSEHVNRMISMMFVPSPHIAGKTTPQQTIDAVLGAGTIQVPEGRTARATMAEMIRGANQQAGLDAGTDSEMLDAIEYFVFPNLCPWAGYQRNIIYRFLPNGNDPDSCTMEIRILEAVPEGEVRKPAPLHVLGPDEDFTKAEELGLLSPIFNQDMGNLPKVQRGLHASRSGQVHLAHYQESRIRHLHRTLDRYLEI